jgi:hypothetical protein
MRMCCGIRGIGIDVRNAFGKCSKYVRSIVGIIGNASELLGSLPMTPSDVGLGRILSTVKLTELSPTTGAALNCLRRLPSGQLQTLHLYFDPESIEPDGQRWLAATRSIVTSHLV